MIQNVKPVRNNDDCSGFRISREAFTNIFFLFIVASPIFTYSLPETVLANWPSAAAFTDLVARYVPAIDKLTALSQFPHVTRLFLAMLWGIAFPVLLILALLTKPQQNHLRKMAAPEWVIWTGPLMGVAFCWVALFMPFVDAVNLREFDCGDTPFDEGVCLASTSRFWLGIFGTTVIDLPPSLVPGRG
ncbi:MAG: hypothetical protein ROZ37_21715 [Aromatoleum sp.]|uniref:hypothetical protein n=1 Tax=Aromatoleum sp. TaxID=2307007 RepID=UPI002893C9A2|nr:hypothetical protein [Aromatoleum sp.]MDT3672941.1 hypothetical protein [Aromatoleum sp.]MDT3737251.1 hypothetical protein [Denitratisoma sp.]